MSRVITWLTIGGAAALSGWVAPLSWWIAARDAPLALAILLAGLGLGSMLRKVLRWNDLPPRWNLLGGLALGLGGLALLVLALGLAGNLHRIAWSIIVLTLAVLGMREVVIAFRSCNGWNSTTSADEPCPPFLNGLWLVIIPFAGLALVGATMPPGILWPAEGNGYDVLEYHLAAPREYWEVGRIIHLPHNIYSHFPFNVEMLYLLAIVLRGDPVAAAFTVQLLNLFLAVLTVAAVWLCGREFSRSCAVFAGVLMAICPFLAYLSGLAYVENGMLFFTTMSLAALIRLTHSPQGMSFQWLIASGAMAGFACGCKYIALPMVLLPLMFAAGLIGRRFMHSFPRFAAIFGLAALVTFSPWLMKNAVMTGNPVFPLARGWMPERAGVWDDDGAARWTEGHLPAPADRTIQGRMFRVWSQIVNNPLFGPLIALAILSGLIAWGLRLPIPGAAPCALLIVFTTGVWITSTHLVDRFAVTLIPACAVIAGWVLGQGTLGRVSRLQTLGAAAVLGLALLNALRLFDIYAASQVFEVNRIRLDDGLQWFLDGQLPTTEHIARLNRIVRRGGKVLMVADARRYYQDRGVDYCVVFNRNPFAEAASELSPDELIGWLQDHGYSHVFVHWTEMRRLRASRYGFWKSIDESLFQRLVDVGLVRDEVFSIAPHAAAYAALFKVPSVTVQ